MLLPGGILGNPPPTPSPSKNTVGDSAAALQLQPSTVARSNARQCQQDGHQVPKAAELSPAFPPGN